MSELSEMQSRRAVMIARDLQMIYRVGKVEVPALRGVDLTVREGEFLAITGPSGCGKSTLLHLMGGLLKPTAGHVIVDGMDLARASDAERTETRRRKIGFVFQRHNLLSTLTAAGNITLARRIHGNGHHPDQEVEHILTMLGLADKIHHKPAELSGGEQQRVAIARAVINKPAILLADEPTGSLDSENSRMVLEMMKELNQEYGQTIVMITHDQEAASVAGRLLEMRDGRILNSVQNLVYTAERKSR